MMTLAKAADDYLRLRRKLGYKLYGPGLYLKQFVSFMKKEKASIIRTELALRWATQPVKTRPAHWAARLRAIRIFAKYHSASDPRTEVPPQGLLSHRPRRVQPYIYSPQQIRQLVRAARRLPTTTGLRPWTQATLMGLIAVTGMRISEALALDRNDVDLRNGVVTIINTKFGKTRMVPIHATTCDILRDYLRRRDRIFPAVRTHSLFLSECGTRLDATCARRTFNILSRQIGLRRASDRNGPRLHDMRHTFAVRTVLRWYREGADVEQRMPILSTYLGHGHITDTYWYLSAVPELLHLAAKRLERPQGGISYDNIG
jgi:integrase/recombinase XerD